MPKTVETLFTGFIQEITAFQSLQQFTSPETAALQSVTEFLNFNVAVLRAVRKGSDTISDTSPFSAYRLRGRRLYYGEEFVRLSELQDKLLTSLLAHAPDPVSQEDLILSIWHEEPVAPDSSKIRKLVQRTRTALHERWPDRDGFNWIQTDIGDGYAFVGRGEIYPVLNYEQVG